MRTWQVERRNRTRHLIELGGLFVKAGIVDLTGDDCATINGALVWIADKLRSEDGERARARLDKIGKVGVLADRSAGENNRMKS
ncbi:MULTISPECIES: conjugal transfer protein TraD [unclassified Nitrobacter]|uniref:conjugal transfer protein TraD n=1 Tax=unclassified Nitrobacter TaxID=2620411 RepID=UPI00092A2010|nr:MULTISPECIES: conjugal transfer protein TraD [unclassified Nitrobacter]MBN9146792.1 conjugal transfer protein TraD [Nitrobacter sp.]OJV01195.1 MAG: conjugal transfer protein TraD [Nitrobacter sp. 62-23]